MFFKLSLKHLEGHKVDARYATMSKYMSRDVIQASDCACHKLGPSKITIVVEILYRLFPNSGSSLGSLL